MKKIVLFLFVLAVCTASIALGQDSTGTGVNTAVHLDAMGWVAAIAAFLIALLIAAKALVKAIPTSEKTQVTIFKWVDGVLGILTFFIKDNKAGGGEHK